jgi:Ulp1 protease family, C-terminal catalytic domain/Leucine Rich repeat/Tetratricopeptide repeat
LGSGRYEEAIKAYEEALTCDPQLAEALSNKAVAWNDKGKALECFERYGEAIAAYEEALKYDSHLKVAQDNKAVAWYKKGIDLLKFNHDDAALAAFDQALAHNPTFAKAQEAREAVLQRLKNPTLKSMKPAKTEASSASSAPAADPSPSAQESQQKSAKTETSHPAEGAAPSRSSPASSSAADNPSSSGQESQQKSAKTGTSRPAEGTAPSRSYPASSSAADNPSSSGQESQQKSAKTETSHPAEGEAPSRSSPASSAPPDDPSSSAQEPAGVSATPGQDYIRQIIQEGAAYFKLPEKLYQQGLLVAICEGFYQELLYLLDPQLVEQVDLSSLPSAAPTLTFLESQDVRLIKSYEQKLKELNKENPNSSSENLSPYAPLLALAQKSGQLSSMQGLITKLCEQLPEKSIPSSWLSETRERTIKNRTLLISDMVDLSDWHPQEIDFTHSFAHLQKAGCRVQTLRLCGWHFLEGEMASLCQALQMPRQVGVGQNVQSAPQNTSEVRTLDLSRIHLKKEDVKQLADMLKVNRSLTTLILAGCKLNDDAVKALAGALKDSNTSLIRIDLSHNPQVTVDSAQVLLDLVQAGMPLRTLELSGNTEIAFWNRQIQKALEVTNDHLADAKIQAERNFFFALLEERQSANTAPVLEGSVSDEGQLPDTKIADSLEVTPDEATLEKELTQQQGKILQEITRLKNQSGVECELAKLNQRVKDLEDHYEELGHLCEAKKQRYGDQQKFRQSENLWVYYCALAQRMEEIFIASKAESSLLMGKTTMAGNFKTVALGIILASKGIDMIVKLSEKAVKGVAGVASAAEFLNEQRQHNIVERVSLLGNLSDCKKVAYYIARHLTERYAKQCMQISPDPTSGWGKLAKEWFQTNVLAKKIPSPIALFAECAVQRMLYALMADWIKVPNDKQEVSEWLGEQLVDEVSKPLTETGTLANTVSLKVQSVYQSLCAWFALNTIQTNDGKEWIIPQIYTHTGIRVEGIEYIDPNDSEVIEDRTDNTPESKTNYRLYGCYEGTMDKVTLCGYKELSKKTSNEKKPVAEIAQQSTQTNTAGQSKVASAEPPVSSKNQAQTNHSSESLPSHQASSIQSINKYTMITKSEYWYQDKEINHLLLIASEGQAQVAMTQTPFIKAQDEKGPCPEVDAGYIQLFQEAIQYALEKDKPTLIPINTISTVTLDDHGLSIHIEGTHWVLLVLKPNPNLRHCPDIQVIDPFGNGDGKDKDMIQDEVNINDHNVTQSHSYRILNLIKQVKHQDQTVNPNTFLVSGLQQQDNVYDCGPYLIENAIAVLKSQRRKKYTDMQAVRERHARWLQEDDVDHANRQGTEAKIAEASKPAAAQVSAQSTPTADTAKQGVPATASSSTVKVGETVSGRNKVGGKNTVVTESSSQKKDGTLTGLRRNSNADRQTVSSENKKTDRACIIEVANEVLGKKVSAIKTEVKASYEERVQVIEKSAGEVQGFKISLDDAKSRLQTTEEQLKNTQSELKYAQQTIDIQGKKIITLEKDIVSLERKNGKLISQVKTSQDDALQARQKADKAEQRAESTARVVKTLTDKSNLLEIQVSQLWLVSGLSAVQVNSPEVVNNLSTMSVVGSTSTISAQSAERLLAGNTEAEIACPAATTPATTITKGARDNTVFPRFGENPHVIFTSRQKKDNARPAYSPESLHLLPQEGLEGEKLGEELEHR